MAEYKLSFDIPTPKIRKQAIKPLTKTERRRGLYQLEGAGLGFTIGGALGGLGGMFLGVPTGIAVGSAYGAFKARKVGGRPPKIKIPYLKKIFMTRRELYLAEKR
jgi:hypothetical protein